MTRIERKFNRGYKRNFKQREKFKKLLEKLKRKAIIHTWWYNDGKFIVDWYGESGEQEYDNR